MEVRNMSIERFRILHSEIIEYYQCIEHDMRRIYSRMSVDDYKDCMNDMREKNWNTVLQELRKLDNSDNNPYFSEEDYKLLDEIRTRRNYWSHQCYLDFVYIQVNEHKQQDLVALLEDFGFVKFGPYKNDCTYVKEMRKGAVRAEWNEEQRLEYDIRHYPHFVDGAEVKKFLVPIQPAFHDRLFPDLERRDYLPGLIPDDTSEANAIKKAYICGSGIKHLCKGDILLFYRSCDRKSIACIGVVEDFLRSDTASDIIPFVARRTVFFDDEIRNKASGGELLAILFRVVRYLKNEVKLSQLKRAGMMGQIQSIREIGDEMYRMVFVPQLKEL